MMAAFKPRVEAGFRRLERKLGIDREGRSVWVWLLPPTIGLVTAVLVPFMPGLPSEMGLLDRVTLSIFGFLTMTAIASIYLISFDNDHNQQAPADGPEARGNERPPESPQTPSGSPPPQWLHALDETDASDETQADRAGDRDRLKIPAASGAPR